MGQTPKYTKALWAELISDLESGDPLRNISAFCRRNKLNRSTPYDWAKSDPEHAQQFARARAACLDACIDRAVAVAFDESIDPKHKRVMVETLFKYAAKMDPARYGEKLGIGGASELPPIDQTSPADLAARAQGIYDVVARRLRGEAVEDPRRN